MKIDAPTILKIANLTTDGFVKTSGSDGTLGIDTTVYAPAAAISGTIGTIPKFLTASTIGDSIIIESAGNVGIGVTPTVFFHKVKTVDPIVVSGADTNNYTPTFEYNSYTLAGSTDINGSPTKFGSVKKNEVLLANTNDWSRLQITADNNIITKSSTGAIRVLIGQANTARNTGSGTVSLMYGSETLALHNGTGVVTSIIGARSAAQLSVSAGLTASSTSIQALVATSTCYALTAGGIASATSVDGAAMSSSAAAVGVGSTSTVTTINGISTSAVVIGQASGATAVTTVTGGTLVAQISATSGGTATVTNARAIQGNLTNSGTIDTAALLYLGTFTNTGTIATTYGIYIGDITSGTQINTPFSFYASDPNALNYFAGNVGVGIITATSKLHVANAGDLSNLAAAKISTVDASTYGAILYLDATSNAGGNNWFIESTGISDAIGVGNFTLYSSSVSGGNAVIVSPAGNMTVGWVIPTSRLTVKQANDTFVGGVHLTKANDAHTWGLVQGTDDNLYIGYATDPTAAVNFSAKVIIQSNGYVGIGVTPASLLTVNGSASIGSGYAAIAAPTNGLIVEGYAGFGISAPVYPFRVEGITNTTAYTPLASTITYFPMALFVNNQTIPPASTRNTGVLIDYRLDPNADATSGRQNVGLHVNTAIPSTNIQNLSGTTLRGINNIVNVASNTATTTILGVLSAATQSGSGNNSLFAGGQFGAVWASSGNITTIFEGLIGSATQTSSGTIAEARAVEGALGNTGTGTITIATALYASISNSNASGVLSTAYGVRLNSITNAGTIGSTYGFYCGDITAGTQTNTPFSFYASDDNALNAFYGKTGFGTITPAARVAINGGLHVGGDTDPGDNNLLVDGDGVITGAFGCNAATAQTPYASGGALAAYTTGGFGLDSDANMQALYNLVVAMRAALVANGIMS